MAIVSGGALSVSGWFDNFLLEGYGIGSVVNCTFVGNYAPQGSAITQSGGALNLMNSILWDNWDEPISPAVPSRNGLPVKFVNNIFQDPPPEWPLIEGSLVGDPRFVAPHLGDYRLRPDSPAIDAGAESTAGWGFAWSRDRPTLSAPDMDVDGGMRPLGDSFDIGAYEGAVSIQDSDSDTIPDITEGDEDIDGDGVPNFLDVDSDGDGIPDAVEATGDSDRDGLYDPYDTDSDNDGVPDLVEGVEDVDYDSVPNYRDLDSDGDGLSDSLEGLGDSDNDGVPSFLDEDSDGDGLSDEFEQRYVGTSFDANGDGNLSAADVQLVINTVLGLETPIDGDINSDHWVNVRDVQCIILVVLGHLKAVTGYQINLEDNVATDDIVGVDFWLNKAPDTSRRNTPTRLSFTIRFNSLVIEPMFLREGGPVASRGSGRLFSWYGKGIEALQLDDSTVRVSISGSNLRISTINPQVTSEQRQDVAQENPFYLGEVLFRVVGSPGDVSLLEVEELIGDGGIPTLDGRRGSVTVGSEQ
jgi:hypothetical protein